MAKIRPLNLITSSGEPGGESGNDWHNSLIFWANTGISLTRRGTWCVDYKLHSKRPMIGTASNRRKGKLTLCPRETTVSEHTRSGIMAITVSPEYNAVALASHTTSCEFRLESSNNVTIRSLWFSTSP